MNNKLTLLLTSGSLEHIFCLSFALRSTVPYLSPLLILGTAFPPAELVHDCNHFLLLTI